MAFRHALLRQLHSKPSNVQQFKFYSLESNLSTVQDAFKNRCTTCWKQSDEFLCYFKGSFKQANGFLVVQF